MDLKLWDLAKKIQDLTDENSDLKHQIEMLKKRENNSEGSEDEDTTLDEEADIEDFYIASKRVTDRVEMERDIARDELRKSQSESKNIIEALIAERDYFEAELLKFKSELTLAQKYISDNKIEESMLELVSSSESEDCKISNSAKIPLPFSKKKNKLSEITKHEIVTDESKLLGDTKKQQKEDSSLSVEKMDVVEALRHALNDTENLSIKAQPIVTTEKKKAKAYKVIKFEEENKKAKLTDIPRKQKMERSIHVEKMDVIEAIKSSFKHKENLSIVPVGTPGKKMCKFPGDCTGCSQPSCETCPPCMDKPSRGGPNRLKQKCVQRKCKVGPQGDSVKSRDTKLGM